VSAPGLVGNVEGYRYVRARVYCVEIDGGEAGAYFEAVAVNDPAIHFAGRVPDAHCPRVDTIITMRERAELVVNRNPMVHRVKCAPLEFDALARGDKRHETRVDDRDYRVGDVLHLCMWTPERGFTGQDMRRRITYKTEGGTWGLPVGLCVLSLGEVTP
jgi:hypothetical protein